MIPLLPGILEYETGWQLPPSLVAAVLAAGMCEFLWRNGIRPRLTWNDDGIALVHPVTITWLRWQDVTAVRSEGNLILVTDRADRTHQWGFDRLWWLARRSPTYADRGKHVAEYLMSILDDGQRRNIVQQSPLPNLRRPLAFLLLIAASAALGQLMTPLVVAP